jgi:hypothetical protein
MEARLKATSGVLMVRPSEGCPNFSEPFEIAVKIGKL